MSSVVNADYYNLLSASADVNLPRLRVYPKALEQQKEHHEQNTVEQYLEHLEDE